MEFATMSETTFYILGAGAIGLSLAVHLVQSHQKVQLVRTSNNSTAPQTVSVSLKGLQSSEVTTAQVDVCSLNHITAPEGVLIVTAKTFANSAIAKHFIKQQSKAPIILMQNGIGVEKAFLEAGFENVYRTVLYSGGEKIDHYAVEFKMVNSSPTGVIAGDAEKLNSVIKKISTPQFPFHFESNILENIWKKSIANAVFNTICPLLEIDNGIFARDETALALANSVIAECVKVANALDINLSHETVLKQVLTISKGSDGQLVSTLQDIQNKRQTEIDSLNLEIAKIAENLDRNIDISLTKALGDLIKIKSSFYEDKHLNLLSSS